MSGQLPALMVVLPLTAALVAPLLGRASRKLLWPFVVLVLLATHVFSSWSLASVLTSGTVHYHFGGWAPPWGIEYVIDPLSAGMASLISLVSLVSAVYSGPYMRYRGWLGPSAFYCLYLLLTSGLLGVVTTGDVFNLYVFLEILSLSTYALIASGGNRGTVAAFRYLMLGTIGASFYLLGVGYLYASTGTLNMADLTGRLAPLMSSGVVAVAVGLVVTGLGIKMALFPLYGWLPDAYSYAPIPITAFISATGGKVAAYALYRLLFLVIGDKGPVSPVLSIVGWAAAAGIIVGSIMAIAQKDVMRMLAYSSISQMGYIALGLSLGNTAGLAGALLHIPAHAFMKSLLFLSAGAVEWRTGRRDIPGFAGTCGRLPLTTGAFAIGALSMVGIPPTLGFFSKWYLALGCLESGNTLFLTVILLSSLLNAIYFFRVLERSYLAPGTEEAEPVHREMRTRPIGGLRLELPVRMLLPIMILGITVVAMGIMSESLVSHIIHLSLPWRLS